MVACCGRFATADRVPGACFKMMLALRALVARQYPVGRRLHRPRWAKAGILSTRSAKVEKPAVTSSCEAGQAPASRYKLLRGGMPGVGLRRLGSPEFPCNRQVAKTQRTGGPPSPAAATEARYPTVEAAAPTASEPATIVPLPGLAAVSVPLTAICGSSKRWRSMITRAGAIARCHSSTVEAVL